MESGSAVALLALAMRFWLDALEAAAVVGKALVTVVAARNAAASTRTKRILPVIGAYFCSTLDGQENPRAAYKKEKQRGVKQ